MLADAWDREQALLRAIPLPQPNEAVLRADARLLPRRAELELSPARQRRTGKPTVTYHMNRLQSLRAEREFCVTLNRSEAVDPRQGHPHDPAHPVFTAEGQAAHVRDQRATILRRVSPRGRRRGERVAQRSGGLRHALRGPDPPPPLRGAQPRVLASHRHGLPRPRGAARGSAGGSRSAPGSCASAAATTSATRPCRSRTRCRALVAERSGRAPEGPIRVLTHLRTLGHCFNPVSFYYCFAADGETLEAVVAEVTNTPWGERHAYVVGGELEKELHVSPFMPMISATPSARPRRARRCRCTSRAARTGASRSTPRSA